MTDDHGDWTLYDAFGDGLSDARWKPFRRRNPDGDRVAYLEPGAVATVDGEALRIEVETFTRCHGTEQGLDNGKHVHTSTAVMDLVGEVAEFRVDMSARTINARPGADYRSGFAMFGAADLAGGFVFDVITNGSRSWAICERLRRGTPFTWVVEAPLLELGLVPGELRTYTISIDRPSRSVDFTIDQTSLFRARDLPGVPSTVQLTFGMLTLTPLSGGGSRSNHGQGLVGWWRQVRHRGAAVRPIRPQTQSPLR